MSALDVLKAVLHGPFRDLLATAFPTLGDPPPLVLAWQVLLAAVIYFAVRFGRGRFGGMPVPAFASQVSRLAGRAKPFVGNTWVLVALAVLLPVVELFTGGYLLTVTYNVELFMLLAIGLNIVVGYTGLLDLGYVAFFAVGAYVYGILASPQLADIVHHNVFIGVPHSAGAGIHISMLILLPLAGLAAAGFGVLIGMPTLRLRGDYLAIVTLGFGEITRIFANNLDQPVNLTNGPNGIIGIDPIYIGNYSFGDASNTILGVTIPPFLNYYYVVLGLIALTIFFVSRLASSRVGRAWAAIREDEIAAEVAGIHTRNLKLLAYASGGFFGGMAGAVFAAGQHLISPESFQLFFSILVLCMVVVGGMGSIRGAALGAIAIGIPYFLSSQLQSLRILIFGVILVAMITLRPQGLLAPSHQRELELEHAPADGSNELQTT